MNEKLKKLWSEHQEAAETIGNNTDYISVTPCLFLLPPYIDENRISKLSQEAADADKILDAVEGYPIFFLVNKAKKNFCADILFLRDKRSKTLFDKIIQKMKQGTYPEHAKKFEKVLNESGKFYKITKTDLENLFAAFVAIKNNTQYKGGYGHKKHKRANSLTGCEHDTHCTGNTIILTDGYEIMYNEDGSLKTAGSLASSFSQEQVLPQAGENPVSASDDAEKIKKLLLSSKQIILTGAPGTGKTYIAKQVAQLITGDTDDTPDSQSHIGFVQFHPSFDYTDFVEGLRPTPPKDDAGTIGFERKDGIFKDFCSKALKNYLDSQKSLQVIEAESSAQEKIDDFLNAAIEDQTRLKTQKGSEFYILEFDEKLIYIEVPNNEVSKDIRVPYAELKKIIAENITLNIPGDVKFIFNRKNHRQHDSYTYALYNEIHKKKKTVPSSRREKIQLENFVFIIDEINRGDISKIFGELFYAIDPGYRGVKGKVKTQYDNLIEKEDLYYGGFYIPENVYIIGTMNDIDRSVESMDFAIRRRFTWKEIKAEDRIAMWDGVIEDWKEEAGKRMNALNGEISKTDSLSDAFHIGPAYFLKLTEHNGSFGDLWELHIQPLLKEYLRGTVDPDEILEKFENAYNLKNAEQKKNETEMTPAESEG